MPFSKRIAPCLWFDSQADEAASFYVSIFPNSLVTQVTRYGKAGHEVHKREPGSVMTVAFELDGQPFTALNGGPIFKFNEAVSLQIFVADQKEFDYYWNKLAPGGDPRAQACGWLKDRFGVSWQVVPRRMIEWFTRTDDKSQRAFAAMMKMGKLDIAALERAYKGE